MQLLAACYRAYMSAMRGAVETVLRFVPSPRGNDGLTANERRIYALKYQVTAGALPAPSPERVQRLHALAGNGTPRVWRRPVSLDKTAC